MTGASTTDAGDAPMFSIITPVFAPPMSALRATIASVLAQTHADWEWIAVDDASPDEAVRVELRSAAAGDPRIRLVERTTNGHIVAASNDGVDLARGTFVVLLDHDDLLAPNALEVMREAILADPEVDYLYSDENKIGAEGGFYDRFAKPDWSPERLRGQMYTGHLSVLRTSLVREVGAFRQGFDGSQDHDLVLRVTERARSVVHVAQVLYHWRAIAGSTATSTAAKTYAWDAGLRAVQEHLDRTGQRATAVLGPVAGTYTIEREPSRPHQRISVIIPTRGGDALVWGEWRCLVTDAVRSIIRRSGSTNLELVVVHDTMTPPQVLRDLERIDPAVVLVPFARPFNFSEKCNVGALTSTGDVLVFLNDDMEIISDDFLDRLVAPLDDPDVGMTGGKLFYADTTVQHAGLAFVDRDYHHVYAGATRDDPGKFNALVVDRECSGLTAACVALRAEVFTEVGGFSELLPANFNDVDLSRKITLTGRRLVWLHSAQAYHFESQTRTTHVEVWEHETVLQRWGRPPNDPYLMRDRVYRDRERARQTLDGVVRKPRDG